MNAKQETALPPGCVARGRHIESTSRVLRPEQMCVRRQMFANHKLAFAAAEMEVHEAKGRLAAQNQLAAAEAQVRRPHPELAPRLRAASKPSSCAAACLCPSNPVHDWRGSVCSFYRQLTSAVVIRPSVARHAQSGHVDRCTLPWPESDTHAIVAGRAACSGGRPREGRQRGQVRVHEPHVPRGPDAAQRLPRVRGDAARDGPRGMSLGQTPEGYFAPARSSQCIHRDCFDTRHI